MIVYNVTTRVDPGIEREWIEWQRTENIPATLLTGYFTEHRLFRLLEQDESDGVTFVTQYFMLPAAHYKTFLGEVAPWLNEKSFEKWAEQCVLFQTVMEVVN